LKYPKLVVLWNIKELHDNGESQGKLETKKLVAYFMEITFPNFRKLTKMEGPLVIKLGGKVNLVLKGHSAKEGG